MAALSGEPWRGLAKVVVKDTATGNNRRAYIVWATYEVGSSMPVLTADAATGDQTEWDVNYRTEQEGTNVNFTLHFSVEVSGSPTFEAPNLATVEMRLPGGAKIGSASWSPSPTGVNVTTTMRFDTDPLSTTDVANVRAGMMEIYLLLQDTVGPTTWSADSRGGGTPPSLYTIDWARGYTRSRLMLNKLPFSQLSLGGEEPDLFAYPDQILSRVETNLVLLESATLTLSLRTSGGTVRRTKAVAGTARIIDFSFTNPATEIVNKDFSNETLDARLEITSSQFGGDEKLVWGANVGELVGDLTELWGQGTNGIPIMDGGLHVPWKAFDNYFEGTGGPNGPVSLTNSGPSGGTVYLGWDFQTDTPIDRVRIYFGEYGGDFRPTTFTIKSRPAAGGAETTRYTHTTGKPDYGWLEITFPEASAGQWKFEAVTTSPTQAYKIGEMELWNSENRSSTIVRTSDLVITSASRFIVDPRITFDQLMQIDNSVFATPPM